MPRWPLPELEDQPWWPALLRDYMTDLLNYQLSALGMYDAVVPVLARALEAAQARELLDLCSGGGGGLLRIQRLLAGRHGIQARAVLSDKYPNLAAFQRAAAASGGAISYQPEPVDATAVPASLRGFRTLFTALHHFPPESVASILEDAVQKRVGIGIFEVTERTPLAVALMGILPLVSLAVTPFIRPLRLSRLLLTYLLPVVPLAHWFDGVVSQLRSYTVEELRAFAAKREGAGYRWEAGQVRHQFLPTRITYLIGYPSPPGAPG